MYHRAEDMQREQELRLNEQKLRIEVDQLKAENDKLRKIAKAAWKCIHTDVSCFECRFVMGGCTIYSAMQEVGIEVGK